MYDINLISIPDSYDAVIIAVAHDEFLKMSFDDLKKSQQSVVYDVKASLDKGKTDGRL